MTYDTYPATIQNKFKKGDQMAATNKPLVYDKRFEIKVTSAMREEMRLKLTASEIRDAIQKLLDNK